jgi:hypothetical protein
MNRVGLAITLIAIQAYADTDSITGSWSWGAPGEAGGSLKMIQAGEKVRFQLELSRGPPSYNNGFIEGQFILTGNEGIFRTDEHGACELHFSFKDHFVTVREVADECGFGYGVTATGTYMLDSAATPALQPNE